MTQNNILSSEFLIFLAIVVFHTHVNSQFDNRNVCRMTYFKSKVVDYNWFAAADYCLSMGATLASIDTQESHRFLLTTTRSTSTSNGAIWLGASGYGADLKWLNEWYVSEGFTNWATGHPSKDQKLMCIAYNETLKKWITIDCYQGSGAAYCEKCLEPSCAMSNCSLLCICHHDMPCVTSATSCSSGCQLAHLSRITSIICATNRYGMKCDMQCFCENGYPCESTTGMCQHDCHLGWHGLRCDRTSCPMNRWGPNCASVCYCQNDAQCNIATGRCISGCADGISGMSCNKSFECLPNQWGEDCSKVCNCGGDGYCNSVTGDCIDHLKGCKFEYQGPACNITSSKVCSLNSWGESCDRSCFCKGDTPCYRKNGVCENGCAEGITGISCNESKESCPLNRWGPNCQYACHCAESRTCHSKTGICLTHDRICDPGWQGQSCNMTKCPLYFFGPNCLEACNCANGNQCPIKLGICPDNQCIAGWSGTHCDQMKC